jgi:hypothetical protein
MKCANCDKTAMYEYQIAKNNSIFYCGKDLPKFLEGRKRAGLLKITTEFEEEKAKALETLSTPVPEIVEEPQPVKKSAKKSTK